VPGDVSGQRASTDLGSTGPHNVCAGHVRILPESAQSGKTISPRSSRFCAPVHPFFSLRTAFPNILR
jgi:hypothetical protein